MSFSSTAHVDVFAALTPVKLQFSLLIQHLFSCPHPTWLNKEQQSPRHVGSWGSVLLTWSACRSSSVSFHLPAQHHHTNQRVANSSGRPPSPLPDPKLEPPLRVQNPMMQLGCQQQTLSSRNLSAVSSRTCPEEEITCLFCLPPGTRRTAPSRRVCPDLDRRYSFAWLDEELHSSKREYRCQWGEQ